MPKAEKPAEVKLVTEPTTESKAVTEPEKMAEPEKATPAEKATPVEKVVAESKPATPTTQYCIVLASQVNQRNAEIFVKQLQERGHHGVRIYVHHGTRRVVYGSFATRSQAHDTLSKLRATSSDFSEAWVYEAKD